MTQVRQKLNNAIMETGKKPYDITSPELIETAKKILEKDNKYLALQEKYKKQFANHQFVQSIQTKQKMDERMREVINILVEKEIE